jgi:hypothetical protein
MPYADLELGLHRVDASSYAVDMRFARPDSDADVRLLRGQALAAFDLARLRELALDTAAYGALLGEYVLADDAARQGFQQAWSAAQSLDLPLRLRLLIGPSAPELHGLRWETLRLPGLENARLTDERLLFSRYLSAPDWRPVKLRAKGQLRALVVIANPSNLHEYRPGGVALAPIDVPAELAQAQAALGQIRHVALASGGSATLDGMAEQLRVGFDILYLVAHGALLRGEPRVWLEAPDGSAAVVSGAEIAARIRELEQRPRLVVLVSCQSAGAGDDGAATALGPRLAEAGVPAVMAMQGNLSMATAARLVPAFFRELERDGQIDRALAVARGAVRGELDWWMPALFMRLKSGRIWYVPGFGEEGAAFEKWPAVVRSITRGQCTPILGNQLSAALLGSLPEIAQGWAERYRFPMAPHQREDLPQVAQYLSVDQDRSFLLDELEHYLRAEIARRYGHVLATENTADNSPNARFVPSVANLPLADLLCTVGSHERAHNPAEPHRVLAELPFPLYLTADPSNLLVEALRAAGKQPQVEICRWNEELENLPSIYDDAPDYQPSVEQPLVFHLFGRIEEPDSLVLTEDDYFDYLIGVSRNKELIPIAVREMLADTALLFLGFRLDEWNFRVLYRSIMSQEGGHRRRRKYAHIAGQVLPEEGRFLEPERARRYLERYFQDADISIFWGSVDDFATQFLEQRARRP